ncbi:MAG: sugar ABC transporter substrate-binding protein [Thermoplasmata archaeon]
MKKIQVFVLVSAFLILAVIGFSQASVNYTNVVYPKYAGGPVTLTVWSWVPGIQNSIDLFEKAYPDIKINLVNVGGAGPTYSKLLSSTAAGAGLPDVTQIEYTFLPQFIDYGTVRDISQWVSQYKDLFPTWAWESVSRGDKVYGIPQDGGALAYFYRKDIFDKYGLTVPKTWNEFEQEAIALHSKDPKIYIADFEENYFMLFAALVWQDGGTMFNYKNGNYYVDFTNPVAMKLINFWGDLVSKGAVTADFAWSTDWYNYLSNGTLAGFISGAWMPTFLTDIAKSSSGNWRVALLPQWNPEKPQNGNVGGSAFCVTTQSKHPEAAALFALWINSQPVSVKDLYVDSMLWPVANVFSSEISELDTPNPFFGGQKIMDVLDQATQQVKFYFGWLPIMTYVQSEFQTQVVNAASGKQSWEDVLKNMQTKVVSFMKTQGYNNVIVGQ